MTWISDVHSGWNWNAAFDPWIAKLDSESGDIGTAGFDLMRPPLFESVEKSLGNRFRLQEADANVEECRTPRPRALSLVRAASQLVQSTAGRFVESSRSGADIETAALDAERAARLMTAQDVRTLVSFDGGRTLSPYRGRFETPSRPLAGYLAVKHMGYWADVFVSDCTEHEMGERVDHALDSIVHTARAGAAAADLSRTAIAALKPYDLHDVLSRSVGTRIGLSLNEGGDLRGDSDRYLQCGEIYSLRVGTYVPSRGACFASATIVITAAGCEVIHRRGAAHGRME
jgi:hypothetical protein